MTARNFPVHSEVTIHGGDTIYRTDEWWKAAVTHSYGDSDPEISIYLWHEDDGWTRKNKYHVKTAEAWHSDKELIERYFAGDGESVEDQSTFPVSDYYHIDQGETVFKTDDWWKSIVTIDQKGSYETTEVIIYLWQQIDGDWRRRQKYAVKDLDDWEEDRSSVNSLLDKSVDTTADAETVRQDSSASGDDVLADIQAEVKDLHLGSGIEEEN